MYDQLGYKYGYSYTRKRDQMQVWRCVRRPNGNECKGSAIHDGKNYFSMTRPQTCSPDINIAAKDAIIKEAKSVGRIKLKTGGLHVAEEVARGQHLKGNINAVPHLDHLARIVNYDRASMRPANPKYCVFKIDHQHIPENFYLGKVKVGAECHRIFLLPSNLNY
jgi:hypothetical protein